jgi:predicted ATPase
VSDSDILLRGIGFSGYRSFATWQQILFDSKVTVLAGINNSGKSNVLRLMQSKLGAFDPSTRQMWRSTENSDPLDKPIGFPETSPFEIGYPVTDFGAIDGPLGRYRSRLAELLDNDGTFWLKFAMTDGQPTQSGTQIEEAILKWGTWGADFNNVLSALGGGVVDARSTMRTLLSTMDRSTKLPQVVTVNAGRKIDQHDSGEVDWHSGRGLVRALGALQNPSHTDWPTAKPKWLAIQRFLQSVTGDEDAKLNIPHDFSTIQVENSRRVLPLSSLGSGLEQLIVLAAAATVTTSTLVCIEEPETNLHPLLQKKLVRYLHEETDNQYVIATHSPHLLDDSRTTAYSIRLTPGGSSVRAAKRPHEMVQICHDLGYRPSDLLQANCLIWVEGPSDRIYVRRWLELVDPSLAEGIDYSIMFYGGRLLSHLSAGVDSIQDFIELRKLNRLSAIIIDSDRTSEEDMINASKARVVAEFANPTFGPGLAWVTSCNTIENYVDEDVLLAAVQRVHGDRKIARDSIWMNPFRVDQGQSSINKVKVAREVSRTISPDNLERLDLRDQITQLVEFIRASNDFRSSN